MKFFIFLLFILMLPLPVFSAKPLVRTKQTTTAVRTKATGVSYSSVKLSRTTNSVKVTFLNLSQIKQINYTLSYSGNRLSQGTGGSFKPSGEASAVRDLYFGTCSSGVCTPHRYIQNAVLLVSVSLNSGKTHTKRYRIRV